MAGPGLRRREFLVATAGLAAACGRPADRVTIDADTSVARQSATPAWSIVLVDGGGTGGFGAYLGEMLGAEGVLGITSVDPRSMPPPSLAATSCLVVYGSALTPPWIEAIDAAVRRGAVLVAVVASADLLTRFGIRDEGAIEATGVWIAGRNEATPLRLHVGARHWTAGLRSETLATFASASDRLATPAAIRVAHGHGCVIAWAFDVARNVACIRQGNPEWTGKNRDAFAPQQLIDAMVGWIRPETLARPDADLYQQAISAAMAGGTWTSGPHVLVDYFPGAAGSVLVATSDAHAIGAGVLEPLLQRVEGLGGRLSVYYTPNPGTGWRRSARRARRSAAGWPLVGRWVGSDNPPPTPAQVAAWRARGHEFAPHPDGDDESVGHEARFERAWQVFADEGYGAAHVSTRTHRILWSGWAHTAHAQRRLGVRMNLDAYNYGPGLQASDGRWAHGHLIGSGLPLRFVNEDGTLVDSYQQPTQIVDEALIREFGGPENLSGEQAAGVAAALIADATRRHPAALCGQFHADGFVGDPARIHAAEALLDGTLTACREASVPVWTASRWTAFLDGRRATTQSARSWTPDSGRLSVTLAVTPATDPGVSLLLPAEIDGRELADVTVDGRPMAPATTSRGGRTWARCALRPGAVEVGATYRR
jgi:hypothetical protein